MAQREVVGEREDGGGRGTTTSPPPSPADFFGGGGDRGFSGIAESRTPLPLSKAAAAARRE